MIAERSISVLSNLLEDIKKIWFISLFIVQTIFIVFYSYSIYCNIDKLIFLITYSILFILSIISFILFVRKHKSSQKVNKKFYRTRNFLKYIVNATMLIVNIIEMIQFDIGILSKILLVISGISLITQIVFEVIKIFTEKYVKDFINAFEKDFELLDFRKWKSNTLKLIDAPLEKLSSHKGEPKKELSKDELRLEAHQKRYIERKSQQEEQKSINKKNKKEKFKEQEDIRINKELNELKSHVVSIFTQKNKKRNIKNEGE